MFDGQIYCEFFLEGKKKKNVLNDRQEVSNLLTRKVTKSSGTDPMSIWRSKNGICWLIVLLSLTTERFKGWNIAHLILQLTIKVLAF